MVQQKRRKLDPPFTWACVLERQCSGAPLVKVFDRLTRSKKPTRDSRFSHLPATFWNAHRLGKGRCLRRLGDGVREDGFCGVACCSRGFLLFLLPPLRARVRARTPRLLWRGEGVKAGPPQSGWWQRLYLLRRSGVAVADACHPCVHSTVCVFAGTSRGCWPCSCTRTGPWFEARLCRRRCCNRVRVAVALPSYGLT
jgi:hypothetical protein